MSQGEKRKTKHGYKKMTAVAKRQWGPQRPINECISTSIEWLEKAKQKNALSIKPPTLYQSYVVGPTDNIIEWGKPLSEIFRWSNKDDPSSNRARDAAIRLLAVAHKTHYFTDKSDKVSHEPYLFLMPDVGSPLNSQYGLYYRLEKTSKTILVGEADLGRIATAKAFSRFPVVLIDEPNYRYKWFSLKHWASLGEQSELTNRIQKNWVNKKERDEINLITDPSQFTPHGTLFDIPFAMKDLGRALGMEWAAGLKKWYLPHGFDLDPVKVYLDYYIATQQKSSS